MSMVVEKKFQCPICGKVFTKPHTVKVHMRLHTGHRPHECHLCSKTFVTGSALKDHLISHVSSRDFVCNRCGAKFKHKGTLKRHQYQHEEYERKRDLGESSDTSVMYESLLPCKQSFAKHYTISAEEALEKFPCLQEVLNQKSQELSAHEIISNDDSYPKIVKQERLIQEDENSFGATIFELTEDDVHSERLNVRVYNISDKYQEETPTVCVPVALNEASMKSPETNLSPNFGILPNVSISWAVQEQEMLLPDVALRYGSHVTRILQILDSQDKQAALIKRMNKTLHNFIVKSR